MSRVSHLLRCPCLPIEPQKMLHLHSLLKAGAVDGAESQLGTQRSHCPHYIHSGGHGRDHPHSPCSQLMGKTHVLGESILPKHLCGAFFSSFSRVELSASHARAHSVEVRDGSVSQIIKAHPFRTVAALHSETFYNSTFDYVLDQ